MTVRVWTPSEYGQYPTPRRHSRKSARGLHKRGLRGRVRLADLTRSSAAPSLNKTAALVHVPQVNETETSRLGMHQQ
jgi:hypothetical protein